MEAKDPDFFSLNRLKVERIANLAKTYLWLNCNEIASLDILGFGEHAQHPSYRGNISAQRDWKLIASHEEEDSTGLPEETEAGKPDTEISTEVDDFTDEHELEQEQEHYSSAQELRTRANESVEAKLELARQLLDLPGKQANITLEENQQEGVNILQQLAEEENADAIHLLAETYALKPKVPINRPLVSRLSGNVVTPGMKRGYIGTLLSSSALAAGSQLAATSFYNAGMMGSGSSFYMLGNSYLLDRRRAMPYRRRFLRRSYGMRSRGAGGNRFRAAAGSGRFSNSGIGTHFMGMAAGLGHMGASGFLTSMGIMGMSPIPATSASTGGMSGASMSNSGSTQSNQNSPTSGPVSFTQPQIHSGRGPGPGGPFDSIVAQFAQELDSSGQFEQILTARLEQSELDGEGNQTAQNSGAAGTLPENGISLKDDEQVGEEEEETIID
ncbi:MAG: hypothetical protein ACFHVJ_14210 [Aestuariibacter sp.]